MYEVPCSIDESVSKGHLDMLVIMCASVPMRAIGSHNYYATVPVYSSQVTILPVSSVPDKYRSGLWLLDQGSRSKCTVPEPKARNLSISPIPWAQSVWDTMSWTCLSNLGLGFRCLKLLGLGLGYVDTAIMASYIRYIYSNPNHKT